MNEISEKQNSPWKSLLTLIAFTFLFSLGIQIVVMILGFFTNANMVDFMQSEGNLSALDSSPFFMYALLASSSFGTFYLPAIVLQKKEAWFDYFPAENKTNILFYTLSAILLVVFGPIMELIGGWNAEMSLPESLRALESWMRVQEDAMAHLTQQIVMVDSVGLLLINIVVMAVLPAIAEEYYFRGSLMHIVQRLVKNQHLTIWLTAVIFSAIHVQFFGFFPRLILGAFFGYMMVWTKNIWVPVFAHFVNNATVTILAFYYTRQGKTFEELQSYDNYSIFVYLGSFILTIAIVFLFYKKTKEKYSHGERVD